MVSVRRRLLAEGWTDDELCRHCRSGGLVRLGRGVYLDATDDRRTDPATRHALLVGAGTSSGAADTVVSHASAAVLHGLPTWGVPLERVHRTKACSGGRVGESVHLHTAPLEPDEVVELDGLQVTSVARTVVDIARTVGFEQAVAVADAALHKHLVDEGQPADAVERAAGRRGCPVARRVVAFADRRSESVGETRSRVAMHRAGLPAPVLQWEVWSAGISLGRVDFAWPELRTVGEFDGRVKYGRLLRPGQPAGDVVFAEKLREDAIRDEDLRMVRWTWPELAPFTTVASRIRRAHSASR